MEMICPKAKECDLCDLRSDYHKHNKPHSERLNCCGAFCCPACIPVPSEPIKTLDKDPDDTFNKATKDVAKVFNICLDEECSRVNSEVQLDKNCYGCKRNEPVKEELLLSPEQIVFELNCSKGIVDTYDQNIITACKDVAKAQLAKAEKLIRRETALETSQAIFDWFDAVFAPYENEMGFTEFNNHVPFERYLEIKAKYQALKKEILEGK